MPATPHTLIGPERWTQAEAILLAVLGGVVFLDALDLSLVQVALPSIGSSLHLAERQLQWIVSAYVLGYGGFLLFGGRSADVLGRRRVVVWGLVALIVASILGALASDGTLLIVARFAKGVSAAFTAPAALSILTTSFREGHQRNRALGIYAAAAASGFIFGLVAGGLLTQLSWRYTFAVVVPVALLLLLATVRVVRPDLAATDRCRRGAGGSIDHASRRHPDHPRRRCRDDGIERRLSRRRRQLELQSDHRIASAGRPRLRTRLPGTQHPGAEPRPRRRTGARVW